MQNPVVTVKGRTRLARETGIGRVNLDLNALEQLFHYRQEDAAAMLGISMTSLKIACRRLGVSRWPYSRSRQTDVDLDASILEQRSSSSRSPRSASPNTPDNQSQPEEESASPAQVGNAVSTVVELVPELQAGTEVIEASHRAYNEERIDLSEAETTDEVMSSFDKKWLDWFIQSDDQSPVFVDSYLSELVPSKVEFLGY
eukprot:754994-Hanusia_phi.AAC.2